MKSCHLCRKPSEGLCNKCRVWKETRYRIDRCPCDVCYEVDHFGEIKYELF